MALDYLVAIRHGQVVLMAHSGIRKNSVFPIIDRILNGIIPVVGSIVVDVIL